MDTAGPATTPAVPAADPDTIPARDPDTIRAVIVLDPVTMPDPDSSPRSLSSATAKVGRISARPDIIQENEEKNTIILLLPISVHPMYT